MALALCAATAADARAATVRVETIAVGGDSVRTLIAELRPQDDDLRVFQTGVRVSFSVFFGDDRFTGPLPAGCAFSATAVFDQQVDCDLTATEPIDAVGAAGLAGADSIDASADPGVPVSVPFIAFGGEGADAIAGGTSVDVVDGGPGDDRLLDTPGRDVLRGGDGDDAFRSAVTGDADLLDGGAGTDRATFDRGRALTVSLNAAADDGADGEGDDVRVEDLVVEGSGATFVGDDGPNVLRSGARGGEGGRSNRFEGGGGDDRLLGGAGRDDLAGGAGDDELAGGDGDDVLDGGDGTDAFAGDGSAAVAAASPGADLVRARDGVAEAIDCGPGADSAEVDVADAAGTCETLDRPAVDAPADGGGAPPAGTSPGTTAPGGTTPGGTTPGGTTAPAPVALGRRTIGLRTPRRDRRAPYVFRLAGRLDAPAGRCAGARIALRVLRGTRRVARRTVAVGADCRWRATVRLGRRAGRYRLEARFLGGPGLAARRTPFRRTLRAG